MIRYKITGKWNSSLEGPVHVYNCPTSWWRHHQNIHQNSVKFCQIFYWIWQFYPLHKQTVMSSWSRTIETDAIEFLMLIFSNWFQENIWFSMGCAAMAIKDWELAKKAFHRCVALDPNVRILSHMFLTFYLFIVCQLKSFTMCYFYRTPKHGIILPMSVCISMTGKMSENEERGVNKSLKNFHVDTMEYKNKTKSYR